MDFIAKSNPVPKLDQFISVGWRIRDLPNKEVAGYGLNMVLDGRYGIFRGAVSAWWPMAKGATAAQPFAATKLLREGINHVHIEARGKRWSIDLNGERLDGGEDASIKLGTASFSVQSAEQLVRFRNFKITKPSR